MQAAADRLEFAPPPTAGLLRALLLALLAHGLLVAALTWGVQWKRDAEIISAEAELWASVPVEAAPKPQEPEPEPTPVVTPPKPTPAPEPEPEPVVQPPKVDIALEKEKQRKLKERAQQAEQEKLRQERLKLEKIKQDKLLKDKLQAEKLKTEKLKQEQADKAKRAEDKKKEELQAKQLEAQRDKNLKRMAGLAGASGGPNATGTALKSAGPSASYAGRIRARIKPNIVFTEDVSANPSALVEVRTAPEGTIISRKLLKSSGNTAWNEAVLKAIDKTEVLPRDTDGSVPSVLQINFTPKD